MTISDGAVIGMGSVVTHDVGPYEIWAGNPARMIRKRFNDGTVENLKQINGGIGTRKNQRICRIFLGFQ